jgi:hypothetical protein
MANKAFAVAADPLVLGTTFEVFRVSTRKGGDWETIYTKGGGFLQRDSRVTVHTLRVDAYADADATIPERGATMGGFVIDEVEDSGENRRHRTVAITATVHQNVTLTSALVRP